MHSRRQFLRSSLATAAGLSAVPLGRAFGALGAVGPAAPVKITVYKSASCGCCKEWVAHMQKNGFAPAVHDVPDATLASQKKTMGIPTKLQSCHTAIVGAFWVEGHVPADVIHKALTEKADIVGLAAPGMPQGSPGMEMGTKEPYDIIALDRAGKTRVYAKR